MRVCFFSDERESGDHQGCECVYVHMCLYVFLDVFTCVCVEIYCMCAPVVCSEYA